MPSNRYCHLGFPPPLFVVPGFLSRREVRHANRELKQADLNDYCLVYQFSKLPTTSLPALVRLKLSQMHPERNNQDRMAHASGIQTPAYMLSRFMNPDSFHYPSAWS
jgi:hypothetical protein